MKEEQAENIINSIDGIERAEPSSFLYTRITERINIRKKEYISLRTVSISALAFGLLILMNWQAIKLINKSGHEGSSVKDLASEYHLINNNTLNYNLQ